MKVKLIGKYRKQKIKFYNKHPEAFMSRLCKAEVPPEYIRLWSDANPMGVPESLGGGVRQNRNNVLMQLMNILTTVDIMKEEHWKGAAAHADYLFGEPKKLEFVDVEAEGKTDEKL